ncbi:hypothetical cytosolic protein [Syntrophus aciditrophicus SB]|uniref:Hypothetical cytosolic protein n=1 Tax=Syntrophus aciditrophicus (strain SB) TaxID=56780 RepID=Q2LQW8_SYNAS|nr:hypothetical cytosolic protein [Syntrophus aciditrophicus SB]
MVPGILVFSPKSKAADRIDLIYEGIATKHSVCSLIRLHYNDRIDLIYEGIATPLPFLQTSKPLPDRIDLIYEGIAT